MNLDLFSTNDLYKNSLIKLYEESDNKVLSGQYIVDKLDIKDDEIQDFFTHFCLTRNLVLCVNPGQYEMSLDWCLNNYGLKKDLNREVILNKLGL
jgi:hypothetical protein